MVGSLPCDIAVTAVASMCVCPASVMHVHSTRANPFSSLRSLTRLPCRVGTCLKPTLSPSSDHQSTGGVLDLRNAPGSTRIKRPGIVSPPSRAAVAIRPIPVARQRARTGRRAHPVASARCVTATAVTTSMRTAGDTNIRHSFRNSHTQTGRAEQKQSTTTRDPNMHPTYIPYQP